MDADKECIEVSSLGLPSVPGYELIKKLGCGGFGSVYLAHTPDGCEVALKVLSNGGRQTGTESHAKFDPKEADHEASVHRRLAAAMPRHPAVIGLHELISESSRAVLVLDHVSGCELARHLAARPEGRLSEAEARDSARQLASAVAHVHRMGVAHMDLKPENVLRQPDGVLRLIDYGSAATFDESAGLEQAWVVDRGGTDTYKAPERLQGGGPYPSQHSLFLHDATDELGRVHGPASDVFSFGVLLYELLCGAAPFEYLELDDETELDDCDDFDTVNNVFARLVRGELRLEGCYDWSPWLAVGDTAKDLVAQAMRAQPAQRPSAEQMLSHKWLREPLVTAPVARLASAEEGPNGVMCVAQLAAALPPI